MKNSFIDFSINFYELPSNEEATAIQISKAIKEKFDIFDLTKTKKSIRQAKRQMTRWVQIFVTVLTVDTKTYLQKAYTGTSLVVQWLRLHAPNAGGPGSIPGPGTRSHVPQLKDPACHN